MRLARAISPVAHDLGALLQEMEIRVQPDEEAERLPVGDKRRDP